jgi:hypothetical protein
MAAPVTIRLGNRDRELRFKVSSMRDFEDAMSGQTLFEALQKRGHRALVTLLWLGLKHAEEKLTLARTFAVVDQYVEDGGDINDLWDAVGKTLVSSGVIGRQAQEDAPAEG